ncbi:MAG: hypothetical protein R3F61_26205 [Myxococcota bacterium]
MTALARWFAGLDEADRRGASGVALCMALYCFHAVWFSTWIIEDAAISYAFAEHFATGEGFVAYPGGEPVEGFSNPTWTLLLAACRFVGLSPWVMGKVLGLGFGLATLPLAYLWARRTAPDDRGNWALVAPLVLAMSTQHTLWAASGLENGLFTLLLTAAVVRILHEGDSRTVPAGPRDSRTVPAGPRDSRRLGLSGFLLGLLAITRPEAPMYAGVIALIGGVRALSAGGIRWATSFLLGAGGPFALWHAWRIWTFAWELPNTYYAKQTDEKFQPFGWNAHGWAYLRNWALVSVHGFVVPLFTLGQTGVRGTRGMIGLGLTGVLLGILATGIGWVRDYGPVEIPAEPELLVQVRVAALVLAAVGFPLLGLGRKATEPRLLAWVLALCAMFFALYAGGDWMRGYRWMSMAAVPLAVLLADAGRELGAAVSPLVDAVSRRAVPHGLVALGLSVPVLGGGVGQTVAFMWGLETTPFDVRRRVLYMQGVQQRLHLDHASLLEVDMGAHMMWSGFELIDMAGLVDVPIAHHHYPTDFVDMYVHDERNPTFAHVHGGWGSRTGVERRPWFRTDYLEIPGYGHSFGTFHIGNHIRKDLLLDTHWRGTPGRRVAFGDVVLEGLDVPAPLVHPGGTVYVELAWTIKKRPQGFRALLFLSDGEHLVVKELPPAYDWLPVSRWRRDQVVVGRHTLTLPEDLAPGVWDVGIAVVGDDVPTGPSAGTPLDADGRIDTSRVPAQPRFMAGEARFPGVLTVTSHDQVAEAATLRFGEAVLAARDSGTVPADTRDPGTVRDGCEAAEGLWAGARRFLSPEDPWHDEVDPAMARELATCWARVAESTRDVAAVRKARLHDHHAAEVVRVGSVLADLWEAEGDAALAEGNDRAAYEGWKRALAADPSRTWVRRRAEEARTRFLEPVEER